MSSLATADDALNQVDSYDSGEAEPDEPIELTPFLSLAVALLYMLMADGEIDDHESSQLQAVIGGNQDVLELAFEYVETISLDQFLKDAPAILSNEDKLCILCNLCDCLLADGVCEQVEDALFQKICISFGYSAKSFTTYYSAISLKNEKSLLGPYDPELLDQEVITPHLAMAVSLIYMMSADGDIAQEEIGQLQVVIGEFENLQSFAMQYVRNVKMNQFCSEAASVLNADQKLLILTNVCDCMMSDGKVAEIEQRLFDNLLAAFGVSEKQFSSYYAPLEIKNFKPFGSDEEVKSLHTRKRTRKKGRGSTFGMNLSHKHSNAAHGKREVNDAANQGEWQSEESHGSLSDVVTRTMQENIQQVSDTFHDEKDVERVSQNATEKIREAVIGELSGDANLQKVQEASLLSNVQKIGANGFRKQQQGVGSGGYADNFQGLDFSGFNLAPPNLVSEIRIDDLQKNIGQVHEKLNQFFPKPNGKSVLAAEPREKFAFNRASKEVDKTLTNMAPVPMTSSLSSNPSVQSTPEASALNVPVPEVDRQNKVDLKNNWPELNFQPVALAPSVRPARKPLASDGLVFQDATAAIEANQAKQASLTNQVTEVSVNAYADETVQLDESIAASNGSTDYSAVQRSKATSGSAPVRPVRSLKYFGMAAAVVIAMPMGVYGYGAIYPSLNCQGQTQQSRFWTTPGEAGSTSVMQENKMTEMHKLEIRRGEVYLDNHRFPLYKELNRDNHFAAQTPVGFHGSYTSHAVESMSYAFEFNAQTQALRVFSQSSGMRFIDGEVGQMRVVAVFVGQCSKPWF
jgi:uncharacterized tellurite resistance protein B-like protein